ncbi:MAG: hypothetical protein JWN34_293 [Bryobacterales bacterium]|nr:hypothetical protein [Bryobacterales bacterium]
MNGILIHEQHLAGPFLVALDLLRTFVFSLTGVKGTRRGTQAGLPAIC